MISHGLLRACDIAMRDAIDDGFVLHDDRHQFLGIAHNEMTHAIHLRLGILDVTPGIGAAGDLHDQRMHLLISGEKVFTVAGTMQPALPFEDKLQFLDLRRSDPFDCQLDSRAFKSFAHELAVEQITQPDRRDERAVLRVDLDQIFFRQFDLIKASRTGVRET